MQGVDVEMDINIIRGAILLVLIFAFLGLWAWAWSKKRKSAFSEASMLPLEEDNGVIPNDVDPTDQTRSTGEGVNHVN
jgi:cytochrome c oxidase cbb3-type subunit 4